MFSSTFNSGIELTIDQVSPLPSSFLGRENFLQTDFIPIIEPIIVSEKGIPKEKSNGLNALSFSPNENDQIPKQRQVKKYKHTKINTTRGPKERRVRLSVNVAQKFFDLQDMLGFDKASQTLDWLLGKSNYAIEELKVMNNNVCLDLTKDSIIKDVNINITRLEDHIQGPSKPISAKESRAKARERARKRTKEKKNSVTSVLITNYQIQSSKERIMVDAPIYEPNPCFRVDKAQRSCTIEESKFLNPYAMLYETRSSNDYQDWEKVGEITPLRPLHLLCYEENAPENRVPDF